MELKNKELALKKSLVMREYYKRNPLEWLRSCVKTIDEKDLMHPIKSFEIKPYTPFLVKEFIENNRLNVAKSRQVMATWTFAALALHTAQFYPYRKIFVISKKEGDAFELVKRMRHIYSSQPRWLRMICPLEKPFKDQAQGSILYKNGSECRGLPQGADQIRMNTASVILIDEASFLDQLEETYKACAPSAGDTGKIIVFSSAGTGYFGSMVEIKDKKDWGQELIPGLWKKVNSQGITCLVLHYTCDLNRNPKTENGMLWFQKVIKDYKGGMNNPDWQQEMEIDFTIRKGTVVFDYLTQMEQKLLFSITDHPASFWDLCKFYGGFDWGIQNNAAFTCVAEDPTGKFWVVWEWNGKKKTPEQCAIAIRECPFFSKLEWIAADPTMWTENQARKDGFTSFYRIFNEEIPQELSLNLMAAHGRSDTQMVTKLHSWFTQPEPKMNVSYAAPDYWKELKGLKWAEVGQDKNLSEKLVDKDNHQWDSVKYIILSHPTAAIIVEKFKHGTLGHLNQVAEAARRISEETGEDYQEVFADLYGSTL